MTENSVPRWKKQLAASEGYLMLEMPEHALEAIATVPATQETQFLLHLQRGLVYRHMQRYREALTDLEEAQRIHPHSVPLQMALAWCYKRTDQLPRAIESAEKAYNLDPRDALLLYNLACYWSLARDKVHALSWLGRALRMKPELRRLIPQETDFDPLRNDPDFVKMVSADGGE